MNGERAKGDDESVRKKKKKSQARRRRRRQHGRRKRIHDSIGPFVLGRTLGRGATGRVKLGVHSVTGQKVAVKIIKKQFLADKEVRARVLREIALMKFIDHPHVMKLYDVHETANHLYMIIEYVGGGELFDLIVERGRLLRDEALRYVSQIIQGMEHCHSLTVCHRDLKPENVLLDAELNVKIGDFGMAQLVRPDTLMNTACGSPHYASPEVIAGHPYDGRKADVWSVGIMTYALVTGELPFDDDNVIELWKKVCIGEFTIPEHMDDDVADLVRRMLVVNPAERISMDEIRDHPCFRVKPVDEDVLTILLHENHAQSKDGKQDYDDDSGGQSRNWFWPSQQQQQARDERIERLKTEHIADTPGELNTAAVNDLVDLGWGTRDDIVQLLLSDEPQLEKLFYRLLCERQDASKSMYVTVTAASTKQQQQQQQQSNGQGQSESVPLKHADDGDNDDDSDGDDGNDSIINNNKSKRALHERLQPPQVQHSDSMTSEHNSDATLDDHDDQPSAASNSDPTKYRSLNNSNKLSASPQQQQQRQLQQEQKQALAISKDRMRVALQRQQQMQQKKPSGYDSAPSSTRSMPATIVERGRFAATSAANKAGAANAIAVDVQGSNASLISSLHELRTLDEQSMSDTDTGTDHAGSSSKPESDQSRTSTPRHRLKFKLRLNKVGRNDRSATSRTQPSTPRSFRLKFNHDKPKPLLQQQQQQKQPQQLQQRQQQQEQQQQRRILYKPDTRRGSVTAPHSPSAHGRQGRRVSVPTLVHHNTMRNQFGDDTDTADDDDTVVLVFSKSRKGSLKRSRRDSKPDEQQRVPTILPAGSPSRLAKRRASLPPQPALARVQSDSPARRSRTLVTRTRRFSTDSDEAGTTTGEHSFAEPEADDGEEDRRRSDSIALMARLRRQQQQQLQQVGVHPSRQEQSRLLLQHHHQQQYRQQQRLESDGDFGDDDDDDDDVDSGNHTNDSINNSSNNNNNNNSSGNGWTKADMDAFGLLSHTSSTLSDYVSNVAKRSSTEQVGGYLDMSALDARSGGAAGSRSHQQLASSNRKVLGTSSVPHGYPRPLRRSASSSSRHQYSTSSSTSSRRQPFSRQQLQQQQQHQQQRRYSGDSVSNRPLSSLNSFSGSEFGGYESGRERDVSFGHSYGYDYPASVASSSIYDDDRRRELDDMDDMDDILDGNGVRPSVVLSDVSSSAASLHSGIDDDDGDRDDDDDGDGDVDQDHSDHGDDGSRREIERYMERLKPLKGAAATRLVPYDDLSREQKLAVARSVGRLHLRSRGPPPISAAPMNAAGTAGGSNSSGGLPRSSSSSSTRGLTRASIHSLHSLHRRQRRQRTNALASSSSSAAAGSSTGHRPSIANSQQLRAPAGGSLPRASSGTSVASFSSSVSSRPASNDRRGSSGSIRHHSGHSSSSATGTNSRRGGGSGRSRRNSDSAGGAGGSGLSASPLPGGGGFATQSDWDEDDYEEVDSDVPYQIQQSFARQVPPLHNAHRSNRRSGAGGGGGSSKRRNKSNQRMFFSQPHSGVSSDVEPSLPLHQQTILESAASVVAGRHQVGEEDGDDHGEQQQQQQQQQQPQQQRRRTPQRHRHGARSGTMSVPTAASYYYDGVSGSETFDSENDAGVHPGVSRPQRRRRAPRRPFGMNALRLSAIADQASSDNASGRSSNNSSSRNPKRLSNSSATGSLLRQHSTSSTSVASADSSAAYDSPRFAIYSTPRFHRRRLIPIPSAAPKMSTSSNDEAWASGVSSARAMPRSTSQTSAVSRNSSSTSLGSIASQSGSQWMMQGGGGGGANSGGKRQNINVIHDDDEGSLSSSSSSSISQ